MRALPSTILLSTIHATAARPGEAMFNKGCRYRDCEWQMSSHLAGGKIDLAFHSFSKYLFSSYYVSYVEIHDWITSTKKFFSRGSLYSRKHFWRRWDSNWILKGKTWLAQKGHHKGSSEQATQTQEMLMVGYRERRLGEWPSLYLGVGWAGNQIKGWVWGWACNPGRRDWFLSWTYHRSRDPSKLHAEGGGSKDSREEGGARNLAFQKLILFLSLTLPCVFFHPLSFKDI